VHGSQSSPYYSWCSLELAHHVSLFSRNVKLVFSQAEQHWCLSDAIRRIQWVEDGLEDDQVVSGQNWWSEMGMTVLEIQNPAEPDCWPWLYFRTRPLLLAPRFLEQCSYAHGGGGAAAPGTSFTGPRRECTVTSGEGSVQVARISMPGAQGTAKYLSCIFFIKSN
jgi:hypothetical protein